MKNITVSIILLFLVYIFLSCNRKPEIKMEVLPFDTMKIVIWELLNADEWNNLQLQKDTTLRRAKNNLKLYQKVFAIHHIDKDNFYYSYKFYEEHPDKMKTLMDTLSSFSQKQKEKLTLLPIP